MTTISPPPGERRSLLCFLHQRRGAAAVEFALIALPFLALIFAILESALVFFAGQTLETAAAEAGRFVMTGQAQTAGWKAADFKTQICGSTQQPNPVIALFDCSKIYVSVKNYSNSFGSVQTAPPIVTDPTTHKKSLDTSQMAFNPGGPRCITEVQLFYQWPIYVSLLNTGFANLGNGTRLLVATSVFRNEPYSTSGSC